MGKTETRSALGSSDKLNSSEIEQLITKVCTNFSNQLENKIEKKFNELNEKLNAVQNTLESLKIDLRSNSNAIQSLELKCDYLEQFVKRNTIQFYGFEERENENIIDLLLEHINKHLNVPCVKEDIDSIYRAGKKNFANKPRPIKVTFISNVKRNDIFSAKRFSKNTKIMMYEDLTKTRYELLLQAKQKYGKREAWSMGGQVYALQDGKKCLITSIKDL